MKRPIPQTPADYDRNRIIERPDGFHWRPRGAGRECGPFETLVEAVEDMQLAHDATPEPGESLAEAENEIGIADWVDPDTGELAEESRPRLEQH